MWIPQPVGIRDNWLTAFPGNWDEWAVPPVGQEEYEPLYDLSRQLRDSSGDGALDTLNYADYPWGGVGTSLEFVSVHGVHTGSAGPLQLAQMRLRGCRQESDGSNEGGERPEK